MRGCAGSLAVAVVLLAPPLAAQSSEGIAATIAGSTRVNTPPARGFAGDGGLARAAQFAFANQQNDCDPNRFEQVSHIAVDAAGNVYIADSANHRIRRLDTEGKVTTVAGSGPIPPLDGRPCITSDNVIGDGGPATSARLFYPGGVAVHPNGSLIIADQQQNRVRQIAPNGLITTIAGNGLHAFYAPGVPAVNSGLDWPTAVAVSPAGLVYFTELHSGRVARINADGRLSTVVGTGIPGFNGETGAADAMRLQNPTGLGFDAAGNLYIADQGNNRVRRVTPGGALTTVAGPGVLSRPADVKVDTRSNVLISDMGNHRVLRIDPSGTAETVAGTGIPIRGADGVPAATTAFSSPMGLAVDARGDVLVVDAGNTLVRSIVFSGRPVIGSIASSADFSEGPIVPGSLVSIFGANLSLGTVRVNEQPAPLSFAGPNQINAQVPYGLEAGRNAAVLVTSGGVASAVEAAPVASVRVTPFVYPGTSRAIALNQDGSLNSPENPEARGRVITLFATGIGAVTPELATGEPAPLDRLHYSAAPASATIGGVEARVLFLGLAPGFIGLAQANVEIPEGAASGAVVLRAGENSSSEVTVSLR